MRFDTVIRNGTVVTATDTCLADVGVNGDKVTAIAAQLPAENTSKVVDAAGCLVIPGGIDVHTHLDMPFGGTTSADDFQTGTIAAAFGGTTTLIDFAIQYKGQTLRQAFDTWMKKAHDKAVTDYAFHCIITDLGSAQLEEMGQLIREGVTSLSCSWLTRASSCSMTRRSSEPCARPPSTAASFACTRKTAARSTSSSSKPSPKGNAPPNITRSRGPRPLKRKPLPAPSRSRKWPERPSTSFIFPATTRSKKSAKLAIVACPLTRRPARNTCISRSKIWTRPDLKARSTSSLQIGRASC